MKFSDKKGVTLIDGNKTLEGKTIDLSKESVELEDCEDCIIKNADFRVNKEGESMLTLNDCKGCEVLNSKFHGKDTKGVSLKIVGSKTDGNIVEGCEFFDLSYSTANGGEPMRIGNSQHSGCWFKCIVRKCYFHDLSADPETVSIKSCGNIIEDCRHENNKSNFTVRHGGYATIRNNKFKGQGGIRIYGYGNIVKGNHFDGNKSDKFPPIILGAGNSTKDPNFETPTKPSGREGGSHAKYAQINNLSLTNNTYQNCKKTIYVRTDQSLRQINSTIEPLKEGPPENEEEEEEETPPPTPTPPQPEPIPEPIPPEPPVIPPPEIPKPPEPTPPKPPEVPPNATREILRKAMFMGLTCVLCRLPVLSEDLKLIHLEQQHHVRIPPQ